MHARTTLAHFQPGTKDEAIHILRDIMLPGASVQQGFKGALILDDPQADSGIIISLWETEADMMASGPPEKIQVHVDRLGELLTAETTQHIHGVLLQL